MEAKDESERGHTSDTSNVKISKEFLWSTYLFF